MPNPIVPSSNNKAIWKRIDHIGNNTIICKDGKEYQLLIHFVKVKEGDRVLVYKGKILAIDHSVKRTILINKVASPQQEYADYYLFLIGATADKYAVFKINPTTLELTAFNYNIGAYITISELGSYRIPSTIQSNTLLTEHVATIENYPLIWTPWPSDKVGYGKQFNRAPNILVGNINCYQPPAFDIVPAEDYVCKGQGYFSYSSPYICGARQSAVVIPHLVDPATDTWEDLGYRDLCLKDVNGVTVEYETKDGHVSTEVSWPNTTFALLSPTLRVGPDYDGAVSKIWINNRLYSSGPGWILTIYDEGYEVFDYFFGSHILAANIGSHTYGYLYVSGVSNGSAHVMTKDNNRITPIDYTHTNGDTNFICFYEEYFSGNYLDWTKTGSGTPESYNDFLQEIGTFKRYMLAINYSGIAFYPDDEYSVNINGINTYCGPENTFGMYRREIGKSFLGITITFDNGANKYIWSTNNFGGTRIIKTSCFANEYYMGYTYVKQEFIGDPTYAHFNDLPEDENWTFVERVIGLVSLTTGQITEHVVTDELLSGLYAATFDKDASYGIGLHRAIY